MSYIRVLPRDAFNEAKLLKCVGKLTLLIEEGVADDWTYEYHGGPFDVQQSPYDGSIAVTNISFFKDDIEIRLSAPLNCKNNWPLQTDLGEEIFDDLGRLVQIDT